MGGILGLKLSFDQCASKRAISKVMIKERTNFLAAPCKYSGEKKDWTTPHFTSLTTIIGKGKFTIKIKEPLAYSNGSTRKAGMLKLCFFFYQQF